MKVLLVAHNFLPAHTGGTEVYTLQLGRELQRRGHAVRVFAAEKDVGLPDLSLRERTFGGLEVTELVNNLYFRDFRETWDHPRIDRLFGELLDRVEPDVVHFQHLLYLSVGCVEEARRRGLPVVLTLHDYWLQCARYGQRVHADQTICHSIETQRCAECLCDFKYGQNALERAAGRAVADLRERSGLNLAPSARRLSRSLARRRAQATFDPDRLDPARVARRRADVERRERELRGRLLASVNRFLSPSRFLRERFLEWGLPADRVQYMRTGVDLEQFGRVPPTPLARPLRVAFLGSLIPAKGAHVLLEAWGRLPADVRAGATLEVHGPERHHPGYVDGLRERARAVGARLAGELARDEVARLLRDVHLLVVPSVWYENSPLVIVEAVSTRTPLLVSDIGGMAEMVEPGVSGYHFRAGDARDLAQALERILRDPEGRLGGLYAHPGPIKSVEEDAAQMEEIYFGALDDVRADAPPADGGP